jgi:hypothetical protein
MNHDTPGGTPPGGAHPLLGTPPSVRRSRFSGFTFGGERLWEVVGIVVLVVLGSLLPYLSMPYINRTVELVQERASLFPAAQFIRGIDPLWLPGYQPGPTTNQIEFALNVFNLGSSLQQIGAVVAVVTCASLFQDEINKFFWWPLHLSGWLLALSPVPLFTGLHLLHRADVAVTVRIGWLPVALAGVLVLVATFRARSRIDTYASI